MSQRMLLFGTMPQYATPETHIASGAWCFTGQEDAFPHWDSAWPLPADPYKDIAAMQQASLAANADVVRIIPWLAEECNAKRGTQHSMMFWETALSPWLLTAVHAFTERLARLHGLIEEYGNEDLVVPVLPDSCEFSFRNSLDFVLHGIQDREFNHYVFSWLLRAVGVPERWTLQTLDAKTIYSAARPASGLKATVRNMLLRLPFPRVKGFSLRQSLSFSATLWGNCHDNDKTIPLAAYAGLTGPRVCDLLPLVRRCLPLDIMEAPIPPIPAKRGQIRILAAEFMQDEAYSLRMASWREGGGRLIDCQHGGNNGVLAVSGSCILDYRPHAHLTWGWSSQQGLPGNYVPVQHPLVVNVADSHREQSAELILVGTEMSAYTYRLKSRPLAAGLTAYRKEKVRFFTALPENIRKQALYRPYFAVKNGLADASYVQAALPEISFCTGDLMKRLLSCRLAVLDHYGTTMHLALAANIPLVCYWDHTLWGMTPEAEEKFNLLRKVGIIQPDAAAAAAKITAIWEDVPGWWHSAAVQSARKEWTHSYAWGDPQSRRDLTRHWKTVLSRL